MKLIIDRQKWLRGEGAIASRLLRPSDGKMCCLGQLGIACGIPSGMLENRAVPSDVPLHANAFPQFLIINLGDSEYIQPDTSNECLALMKINDGVYYYSEAEREHALTMEFAKHDIQVEFIN